MDPVWLARNIGNSWRYKDSFADFVSRLRLLYDRTPNEWEIGFTYPEPVGKLRLALRNNDGSDNFIHGEVFEHRYYDLGLPKAPKTVLDLGANIGLTAIWFARTYPGAQIACVEPMPVNLKLLERNLALNSIDARVFSAAVAISDGEVNMHVHAKDYGHKIASADDEGELLTCRAISVPTIMNDLGWDRIGLLKMDIEGYESLLFASPAEWMNRVDALCIECHDDFGEPDLQRLAAQYGFTAPRPLPGIWLMTRA
jgi:FkbM family methyltransferase